jgi:hypothetical protein
MVNWQLPNVVSHLQLPGKNPQEDAAAKDKPSGGVNARKSVTMQ